MLMWEATEALWDIGRRENSSAPPLPHLLLQLLRRAESLVHIGGKLLHLVVHQQILRPKRRAEMSLQLYSAFLL